MKTKKLFVKALLGAMVVGATIMPIAAASVSASGGTWNYGVDDKYVWSDYLHNSKTHKSSVTGFVTDDSGWKKPTVWAKSSAIKRMLTNHSYYDIQE